MKKIILASVVASALLASNYEVTPMVGYVSTKDHVDIENHAVAGVSVSRVLGEDSKFSSLEIGLLQSGDADYDNNAGDTKITQVFYNALKDYKLNDSIKVYALAGLGYEWIATQKLGNESDPFFNYGIGAAYTFANDFALKLDVRHQLKFDGDKNIVSLLGLSIPFGTSAKKAVELDDDNDGVANSLDKCPTTKANVKVNAVGCEIEQDDDHDTIINKNDKCPKTKIGATVDAHGCEVDDDNDGVVNSLDKCPTTVAGTTVDAKGCEVLSAPADLGIVFDTNSANINDSEIVKFDKYVTYLKNVSDANIILEAHTDSVGNEEYNLQLSQRRAQSAKAQLVSMGISADRITAIGYGETKPLVANDSASNMKKNRRVTARIEK